MGSIDKALPHAGFYPDSQNIHSDAAKISIISESCKYFSDYYKIIVKNQLYSITFLYFCRKEVAIMAVIKDKDITTELQGALVEVKEAMDGKRRLNTLDRLIDELRLHQNERITKEEIP